jgi:hypothetical protein
MCLPWLRLISPFLSRWLSSILITECDQQGVVSRDTRNKRHRGVRVPLANPTGCKTLLCRKVRKLGGGKPHPLLQSTPAARRYPGQQIVVRGPCDVHQQDDVQLIDAPKVPLIWSYDHARKRLVLISDQVQIGNRRRIVIDVRHCVQRRRGDNKIIPLVFNPKILSRLGDREMAH